MSQTVALLSIAVVGMGGIGSTFAYYLAQDGHDVTVVARPGSPRLAQLQLDGGIVLASGERVATRVLDRLDAKTAYDLVIVTTLAHQVDGVLPDLKATRAKALHFMMNNFDTRRLTAALSDKQCSFGMPFVMARLVDDGRLDATINSSRKTLHGSQAWADLFDRAGIASSFEAQMELWLKCHVPMCVAMESVAYKAQQRGGGATWGDAMVTARGMSGGFAVVKGMGIELYPGVKKVLAATPNVALAVMFWGLSRNAGFRELLATGVGECRALVDVLVAAGGKMGRDVDAVRKMKP